MLDAEKTTRVRDAFLKMSFSPRKNLDHVRWHQQQYGVAEAFPLAHLREAIATGPGATMECSIKLQGVRVHAGRFHVFNLSPRQQVAQWEAARILLDRVASHPKVSLDRRQLLSFASGLYAHEAHGLFFGLDLREDLASTRVKVWFGVPDGDWASLDRAIMLHGGGDPLRNLVLAPRALVGFDMRLDGTSAMKVYPYYRRRDWEADPTIWDELSRALAPEAMAPLASDCDWVHIAVDSERQDRVMHYHTRDPGGFIERWVNHPMAPALHAPYAGVRLRDAVVSLSEEDLIAGQIGHMNLYYTR